MSAEALSIDYARNERACRLIMHGIALQPQSTASAPIIASNVLKSYAGPTEYPVDFEDIASVDPLMFDGLCDVVHAVHERFGVSYRPTAAEIAPPIRQLAAGSMYCAGRATLAAQYQLGRPILSEFAKIEEVNWLDVGACKQFGATLHDWLSNDIDGLKHVTTTVKKSAMWAKQSAYDNRRALLAGHIMKGANREQ